MTTDQIDEAMNKYYLYLDDKNWAAADRLLQMVLAITQGQIMMRPIKLATEARKGKTE